jgi:hypothetical protein
MSLHERKTYDHLHDPADSFMKGSTFTEECIDDAKVWLNNWVHWNLQSVSPSQCSWDCWWHSHPSASHCKQPQMVRIFKSLAHNPEPPGREKQMHHQTESILARLVTWKFDGVCITETGWHGHWIITILQPQRWIWNDRMEEETISTRSAYWRVHYNIEVVSNASEMQDVLGQPRAVNFATSKRGWERMYKCIWTQMISDRTLRRYTRSNIQNAGWKENWHRNGPLKKGHLNDQDITTTVVPDWDIHDETLCKTAKADLEKILHIVLELNYSISIQANAPLRHRS